MLLGTEIPCYSVAWKILPLHSFRQHKFLVPAPCLQKGNGVVLIYAVSVIWMLDNAES